MSSTDRGILRRLQESNAPIFGKTLTRSMLRRTERLEIPLSFLRERGDRFRRVISLTGPNDSKSWPVPLIVRTCATRSHESSRVYLGRAWKAFAKANGFQVGDDVIFWLSANSTFRVLLCSPKFVQRDETIKRDEDCGSSDGAAIASEFAPQHSKRTTNHEDVQIFPPGDVDSTPAEAHAPTRCVEAAPPQKLTSKVREEEYFKYPGLNSAVSANSRFPQFVRRLTPCNFDSKHAYGPEFPFAFVKENGEKFRERVTLFGASDHLRVVHLHITTFAGCDRVYLGKGWKNFSLENGLSEGDVLLFSLVGVSTFVVKMFPGGAS